jgi:hypothetical protein
MLTPKQVNDGYLVNSGESSKGSEDLADEYDRIVEERVAGLDEALARGHKERL